MDSTATAAAQGGPQSTGTATASPPSPATADQQTPPNEGAGKTNPDAQKAFDTGYARGLEKAKKAESERDAAIARLSELESAGKSAQQLAEELKTERDAKSQLAKEIAAYQERDKADLLAKVSALPKELAAHVQEKAGDDVKRMRELYELASLAAKSQPATPQAAPGGTIGQAPALDLTEYIDAMNRGNTAAMKAFETKHGEKTVLTALQARGRSR
jgi:hypothetical protein